LSKKIYPKTLPLQVVEISGLADEKQTKKINKDWWQCIEMIHEIMKEAGR
jgi:hypothetical protein